MLTKNNLLVVLSVFLFLIPCTGASQQVNTSLEPEKIFMGEHVTLSFDLEVPAEATLQMPVLNEMIHEKVEILNYGTTDTLRSETEGYIRLKRKLRITSWEEGFHAIAPIEFLLFLNGDTLLLESEPMLLEVETFSIEEHTDLKDIKGILTAPVTLAELKYYILGIILLIILTWLAIRYWKKRKKKPEPESVWEKPEVPPHIAAISSLEKLKAQKLWQQGKVKAYHIQLTDIIRRYLEKRFKVGALEMTTAEIMQAMENKPEMHQNGENLREMLILADLVKFAKHEASATENEISMDMAFEFVNNTRQISSEVKAKPKDTGEE